MTKLEYLIPLIINNINLENHSTLVFESQKSNNCHIILIFIMISFVGTIPPDARTASIIS